MTRILRACCPAISVYPQFYAQDLWISRFVLRRFFGDTRMQRPATPDLRSARTWNPARREELLQRLAAESGHDFRIGNALHAGELLDAEEARAVLHHCALVQVPDHFLFFFSQSRQGGFGIVRESFSFGGHRESMQEPVEAQALRAQLEIEHV